jgi:hypothetical protein
VVQWLDLSWKNKDKSPAWNVVFLAAGVMYVLYNYLRFWLAIVSLPFRYLRRVGMFYFVFFHRMLHGSFLASKI